jgi:hypothetical protein
MCEPASFVLTKDAVFWSRRSDSHEDIIDEFKLHADGDRGPNIVRVEITPPNGDMRKPLVEWHYRLDQRDYPKWYSEEDTEKRARIALQEWFDAKVIVVGERDVRDQQAYAYNSTVTARENSTVSAWGNSTVSARENSTVTARENSTVTARENSTVTAANNMATVSHYSSTEPCKPVGPYAVVIDRRGDKAVCVVGK